MKRFILLAAIGVSLGSGLFAQNANFKKIFEAPVGNGQSKIQYSDSVYHGLSPNEFAIVDGRFAWVSQVHSAALIDLHSYAISKTIEYPKGVFINQPTYACFDDHWGIFFSPMSFFRLASDYSTISDLKNIPSLDNTSWIRPVARNGYVFIYGSNGKLKAIKADGNQIDNDKTLETIIRMQRNSASKANDRSSLINLLINNNYLIIDQVFYPKDTAQLYQYFTGKGYSQPNLKALNENGKGTEILGVSISGEIVIKQANDLYVFNQKGELLGHLTVNLEDVGITKSTSQSPEAIGPLFTINFNGDVYAIYVVSEDKAYFFKAERDWGTDYIQLAKNGIKVEEVEKYTSMIGNFNNEELRIVKNAFFALQGYEFKSWDLRCYFSSFLWYCPNGMAKDDPTVLSENQKRLYNLVIAEESERK